MRICFVRVRNVIVHPFQGAERKVIIFSSVYGSEDGCYFIDAGPSMMNVAMSRAKAYFFVFRIK
ncbi:AAA domain-containing protein [Listeria booriae]|uniref:AAA domain-containing protein n=1 Tax=Listeria booriae TaxID=1552123 RepID=UPI00289EAB62|nr:AAA domain-containing protein [Listeria booriae]